MWFSGFVKCTYPPHPVNSQKKKEAKKKSNNSSFNNYLLKTKLKAVPLPASVVRHPKNFDGQKIIN